MLHHGAHKILNSNRTFIVLNLPFSKGILMQDITKTVNQSQYPGTEKRSNMDNNQVDIKTMLGVAWERGRI